MGLRGRRGYTLVELLVACLIVGVMAGVAIPQYMRSVESSKFDDAVAIVNQIGMTNRMFALDHSSNYAGGQFPVAHGCTCTAGSANDCAHRVAAGPPYADPCILVCCNYLPDQDWVDKPYSFDACTPGGGGSALCLGHSYIAGASRWNTTTSPYSTWGMTMDPAGSISGFGTTPPTPSY